MSVNTSPLQPTPRSRFDAGIEAAVSAACPKTKAKLQLAFRLPNIDRCRLISVLSVRLCGEKTWNFTTESSESTEV